MREWRSADPTVALDWFPALPLPHTVGVKGLSRTASESQRARAARVRRVGSGAEPLTPERGRTEAELNLAHLGRGPVVGRHQAACGAPARDSQDLRLVRAGRWSRSIRCLTRPRSVFPPLNRSRPPSLGGHRQPGSQT